MDRVHDEIDGPYLIPLKSIRRWLDPFRDDVWNIGSPVTRTEVRAAIREGRLDARQNTQPFRLSLNEADHLAYDAERIAYLTVNPCPRPISIDVVDHGDIRIEDGCHRIAAAIMRGDEHIGVEYGGRIDVFHKTFRKRTLLRPAS